MDGAFWRAAQPHVSLCRRFLHGGRHWHAARNRARRTGKQHVDEQVDAPCPLNDLLRESLVVSMSHTYHHAPTPLEAAVHSAGHSTAHSIAVVVIASDAHDAPRLQEAKRARGGERTLMGLIERTALRRAKPCQGMELVVVGLSEEGCRGKVAVTIGEERGRVLCAPP